MNSSLAKNKSLSFKKSVLVTGATGFLGSHLVRQLVFQNYKVTILARKDSNTWRLKDIGSRINIVDGDLSVIKEEAVQKLYDRLPNVDIVFHLAATGVKPSDNNTASIIQTNVTGTSTLLKWAREIKVKRFVFCGSCFEYGMGKLISEKAWPNPLGEYGISKLSAWFLVSLFFSQYQLPVVSLRPFTLYGPWEDGQRLIPFTILKALEGKDIELTAGEQQRDFVFVEDAVEAFVRAAETHGIAGETFNVASGKAFAVKEIVLKVLKLMNSKAKPVFGSRLYRATESPILSGDVRLAKEKLGWTANTSLEEGLQKTISWFEANRKLYKNFK